MKMAAQSHTAGELPLEELLALYGYTVSDPEKETCRIAARLPDMTLDKDQITEDLFPGEEDEESSADDLTPSVTSNTSDLLRRLQGRDKDTLVSSSDEDSDDASIPSNEEHKEIMVGSMYQAKIPPLRSYSYQERDCSSEDQLLWRPGVLPVQEVEEFLLNAQSPHGQQGAPCTQTRGDTVRDNQQALYELVKCNFNAEEALRRLRFNVKVFSEELCVWSEEECRSFEHGFRVYGKNFHLIHANKVRTRSVGECVEYYYMWKKSDRHEYFTQQATRLSRKKFSLQSESMEDGDQDGEVGELEESNNSSSLLSHSSMATGQLESPLPPQASPDQDKQGGEPSPPQANSPLSLKAMNSVQTGHRKQAGPAGKEDGELVMGLSDLCGDGCPQQLFGCPFSLPPMDGLRDPDSGSCCPSALVQLQSPPSLQSSQWAGGSPPSCHDDYRLPGSCFYQLHMYSGPFVSEGPDCDAAGGGTGSPHGLQVEFSLPSASPPSSSVLPSHFQAFGSLLHFSPVQHPRSLTQ
ncbi:mesoderm induction early response protein 2 isoform X1 [Perca flavescens]|uniref:mesoderm induction early response protein 2 isoform X1 n=1 Tax=Perca flavescens TaxID=8167 RepID=UPI00106DD73A|nr:mesoderm induction early response protein 2-like isoform X1 [Perca flavescens]XP_028443082.1 mesoderm induction early response protein 2-like isoform X1 [Perca flavescens]XP_028443083.1 mesoderm induction early response protein 2-like isoform X1 [Perca flavescens]XP_028443084.1 mesoderm induction early response protein 2-like isoform X1 [Perca flavescens]